MRHSDAASITGSSSRRPRLVAATALLLAMVAASMVAAQEGDGDASPLKTWRVTLPARRGVVLWARNPTSDPITVTEVTVSGCVNVRAGCGATPLHLPIAPGDSVRLVTVYPLAGDITLAFRWSHRWSRTVAAIPPDTTPLPAWAVSSLDVRFRAAYTRLYDLTPDLLEPDLDGDGEADLVFLVRDTGGRRGIVLLRHSQVRPDVIGAGTKFGNGGEDWRWMDEWSVEPGQGLGAADRLYVGKSESASALIGWNGTAYEWEQAGD